MGKCFCHLNGYEVKDAQARKDIDNEQLIRKTNDDSLQSQINSLASGSPLVASSVDEMTDTTKVYVNTTDGHWYYYNGAEWIDGGVYQSVGLADGSVTPEKTSFITHNISDNLFNPNECVLGKYIGGSSTDGIVEKENSAFAYYKLEVEPGTNYKCSGTSFSLIYADENNNFITQGGNSSSNVSDVSINISEETRVKYAYINFRPATYPVESYMIVKGDTLPSSYIEYIDEYIHNKKFVLNETMKKEVENIVKTTEHGNIYRVGLGREYTSFTSCIRDLKDDDSEKIILIDGGEYDIFEEIGGSEFALSISEGTNWRDVSDIVPPNTTIKGIGNVVFKFTPTLEEIGSIACNLLSPLNIAGTCTIENIKIIGDNCRYCIHDETSGNTDYTGAIKKYKDVHCIKTSSNSIGYAQAYASGFDDKMEFYFENCIFESNNIPFSVHNRDTASLHNSSKITANNCVFTTTDTTKPNIRLGNINWRQEDIKVILSNCHIGRLKIYDESGYGKSNGYEVTLIRCNETNIDIDNSIETNIYPVKIYE